MPIPASFSLLFVFVEGGDPCACATCARTSCTYSTSLDSFRGKKAIDKCKEEIQCFIDPLEYRELHPIDGEPVVFEWKIFTGLTTLQLL